MEIPIKIEPCNHSYEYANIEIKQESEVEISEIDETIFLQGCLESSETIIESNIYQSNEDVIIDEIIKEEPVFYDASQNQVLSFQEEEETSTEYFEPTTNLGFNGRKKQREDKTFECYICKCETVNIGLLKWHLQERHSQEPSLKNQHSAKAKLKRQQLKKRYLSVAQTQNLHQQKNIDAQKHSVPNQSTESVFECSYCHRKFESLQGGKKHERIHTNTQPFKCSICFKGYNHKINFEAHLRVHTGEKPYSCKICEMKFRSQLQLYRHKKTHDNGIALPEPNSRYSQFFENVEPNDFPKFRFFECYLCQFRGHKNQLQVHMREEHTGKNLSQCEICLKKFVRKDSLRKHKSVHSNSNQRSCKICGKKLVSENALKLHLQIHTGEYTHECKYCHKKYSTIKILRNHIRTHTGLKPHECEYCKKGFVRRADMVRHTRIHTGERPYKCDICASTFSRNHLLTDHKRSIHNILKPRSF